jgi:hypothetical protein
MTLAILSIVALLILGLVLLASGIYFMFWGRSDAKGGPTQAGLKDILTLNVPAQALLIIIGGAFFVIGTWLAVTHSQDTASPVPRTLATTPTNPSVSFTPTQTKAATPSSPSVNPSASSRSIEIIRPETGSNVKLNDTITIQVSGASMSRYVWLLVKLGSQVYPQGPCNNISITITSCLDVRFGDPGMPVGTKYVLTAVLVNAQGNRAYMPKVRNGYNSESPPVQPILSSSSITVHGLE